MQINSINDSRNVIPRWRPLQAMGAWELGSARELSGLIVPTSEWYSEDLNRWRAEASVAAAADIFSAGLATGDQSLVWEGGLRLVANPENVEERVLELAKRAIAPKADIHAVRQNLAGLEQSTEYIRKTIKILKKRLIDYPRNSILSLEISRNYTILGQYDNALKWLMRAYNLAPDNRVILRSLVQFHEVIGDLGSSLPYLWRTDGLKYDPLIQSAEVAAAEMTGRASRAAKPLKNKLLGLSSVPKTQSEAALALATLEQSNGVGERAVFKLVRAGLANPTENAVAQAVWVSEQSNRPLTNRFPALEIQEDAFEARANILFEGRQYEASLRSAHQWLLDQPFQAHPLAFICTCAAIYTDAPGRAIRHADTIMARHSSDWTAVNAALLAYNETGSFRRAQQAVDLLTKLAGTPTERAFASAGAGLVAFSTGRSELGRGAYMEAIKLAKLAKRSDLTFTAAAFYILGEARFGHPDLKELASAVAYMDRVITRLDPVDRPQVERLWDRVKELIARSCSDGDSGVVEAETRLTDLRTMVDDLL